MAYANTKKGNNSAPKTKAGGTITFYACLDYTRTETATQVKLAWRARLESTGTPTTKGSISGTGQTKVSFSAKTPSSSGDGVTMGSGTWTWNKETSGATKTVTLKLGPTSTATDYEDAISTASISVSVPALTPYNIAYNANGGSGSMSSQTKYYGKTLTLRTNTFTRTGYTFQKYNTVSGGTGTSYSSGGSYTANAAATMYAQWKANTYTVSFNANGGSGAPASQTKTYDKSLTLTTAKPTRTNYAFNNWNTAANGSGTSYSSGGTFSTYITSNTTLYAQWYAPYTVSYDANGGTGAPASQTKVHDTNLTLSTAKPTRDGYTFAGWNTSPTASDVTYASGATYTANAALSLHAIWKPVISATLTLSERCSDSACTVEDESGAYVKASVSWSCPVSVTSSSLSVRQGSGLTVGTYDFTAGTSGSYSAVISGFDQDKSYQITATFSTDAGSGYMAGSNTMMKTARGAVYIFDFNGKTGIGIGTAAPDNGLRVAIKSYFGSYPVEDAADDYSLIIGNGTDDANRSNALAVTWSGDIETPGGSITPVVLYDNDSMALNVPITLSETAANFRRLTICYKTNDNDYSSVEVWRPDGKTVSLIAARTAGTTTATLWLKSKTVLINGTTINTNYATSGSTNYYQTSQVRVDGSNAATRDDYIAITQVIGYR